MIKGFILVLCEGLFLIHQTRTLVNLAQYRAYKGQPEQSVSYPNGFGPDKAVDGQLQSGHLGEDTCSITAGDNTTVYTKAWWKFPLKILSNLAYLEIYFRTAAVNRHVGFSVYLFNDTSFIPPSNGSGDIIFTQNISTCPDQVMTIKVNRLARGLALYIDKEPPINTHCPGYSHFATIEVCEVKVMGCHTINYGEGCVACDSKCLNQHCDVFDGSCIYGCTDPRKKPPQCLECLPGYYGPACNKTCGQCKTETTCNTTSGICPDGCTYNWTGLRCDKCNDGFYGPDCSHKCGNCQTGTFCNNITGICEEGCLQNWAEPECNVCLNGIYGENCTLSCGSCLNGTFCNKTTGDCPKGCEEKWQGLKCDECIPSYYGPACNKTCGQCKTETICNTTSGICPDGCMYNWTGLLCDICLNGIYGENCTLSCGSCLNGTFCNKTTGDCPKGCEEKWQGLKCDVCRSGFYGLFCNNTCGNCSYGTVCNPNNGLCPQGCQEDWTGPACHEPKLMGNQDTESAEGVTVGVMLGSIFAVSVIGVALIFLYIRRRGSQNAGKTENSYSQPIVEQSVNKHTDSEYANVFDTSKPHVAQEHSAEESDYYNTSGTCTDIEVNELQVLVVDKLKGEPNLFYKEYKRLPPGDVNRCQVGQLPENKNKNRFKTTFPFDHSRAVLNEKWNDSDGDYINANYIKDYQDMNRYLAAQGPKSNTLVEFWRLIWQENIECIVMLTNLFESGKNKCTKYWPDEGETLEVGHCRLTLLEEVKYVFFTQRKLSVQRIDSSNKRQIIQLHYTSWPDHGTPEELGLVQFHRTVTKRYKAGSPLLVHCSAGVGRTGTFIGYDSLLRQGKATGLINVFEFVRKMRKDRMSMVQTQEQYIFLHEVLVCGFLGDETSIQRKNMEKRIRHLLNDNSPQNQQTLFKEFKLLSTLRPVNRKNSKEGGKNSDSKPNAADDKYRAYLTSYVKGRSDFINAVIVPSFLDLKGFIITHNPLPDTEIDVWRLCMDHDVDVMVVLASNEETRWLPKPGTSRVCSPYKIATHDTGSNIRGIIQEDIQILLEGNTRDIQVYKITNENQERLLEGVQLLLEKDMRSNLKTLMMSKNGAGSAGVFIVLHNALQQLRVDGEVDVFSTVRQIKSRRPEVIANLEEYRSCYQLLLDSRSEDVYANV